MSMHVGSRAHAVTCGCVDVWMCGCVDVCLCGLVCLFARNTATTDRKQLTGRLCSAFSMYLPSCVNQSGRQKQSPHQQADAYAHTRTHTGAHMHTHTQAHTHAHSHTHAQKYTHTHVRTQAPANALLTSSCLVRPKSLMQHVYVAVTSTFLAARSR